MSIDVQDSPQTASSDVQETFADKAKRELIEWGKVLSVFVPAFFLFSMLLYEQRVIPSESMVPNLQVGDRVVTNKMAYGYSRYSVPWGLGQFLPLGKGRVFASMPKRGDVIVFMHPHTNRVMIKRLIGLPGDEVQWIDGVIHMNGEPVSTEVVRRLRYQPRVQGNLYRALEEAVEYEETLGDKSFLRHDWVSQASQSDNTPLFKVPEKHFLFAGDNRDNSLDGRNTNIINSGHCPPINGVIDRAGCEIRVPEEEASIGYVPFDNLIGRAETVLWTLHRCRKIAGAECPQPRVWKGL